MLGSNTITFGPKSGLVCARADGLTAASPTRSVPQSRTKNDFILRNELMIPTFNLLSCTAPATVGSRRYACQTGAPSEIRASHVRLSPGMGGTPDGMLPIASSKRTKACDTQERYVSWRDEGHPEKQNSAGNQSRSLGAAKSLRNLPSRELQTWLRPCVPHDASR